MRSIAIVLGAAAVAYGVTMTPAQMDAGLQALRALKPHVGKAGCHYNGTEHVDSCCAKIESTHIIKFNDSVCLNATLHPAANFTQSTIEIDIAWNGDEIYDHTFDLDKLEKVCTKDIAHLPIELCADFSSINLTQSEFSACAEITIEALKKKIASVNVGCFHFHV
jgi:hypothetical protein